jgi:hypothetical protein
MAEKIDDADLSGLIEQVEQVEPVWHSEGLACNTRQLQI